MNLLHPQIGISLPPGVDGETIGETFLEFHCLMWKNPSYFNKHCEVKIHWWGDEKTDGSFFSPITCSDQNIHLVEKHLIEVKEKAFVSARYPIKSLIPDFYRYFKDLSSLHIEISVLHSEKSNPKKVGETYLSVGNVSCNKPIEKRWLSVHNKESKIVASVLVSFKLRMFSNFLKMNKKKNIIKNSSAIFQKGGHFGKSKEKKSEGKKKEFQVGKLGVKGISNDVVQKKNGKKNIVYESDNYLNRIENNVKNLINEISEFETENKNEIPENELEIEQINVFQDPNVFIGKENSVTSKFKNNDVTSSFVPSIGSDDLNEEFDDLNDDNWVENKIKTILPKTNVIIEEIGEGSKIQGLSTINYVSKQNGNEKIKKEIEEKKNQILEKKNRIRVEMERIKNEINGLNEKDNEITEQIDMLFEQENIKSPYKAKRDLNKRKKVILKTTYVDNTPQKILRNKPEFVDSPRIGKKENLYKILIIISKGKLINIKPQYVSISCKLPISVQKKYDFTFRVGGELVSLDAIRVFKVFSNQKDFLRNLNNFSCVFELRNEADEFIGIQSIPLKPFANGFINKNNDIVFINDKPIVAYQGLLTFQNPLENDVDVGIFDITVGFGKSDQIQKMEREISNFMHESFLQNEKITKFMEKSVSMPRNLFVEKRQQTPRQKVRMSSPQKKTRNFIEDQSILKSTITIKINRASGLKQSILKVNQIKKLGLNLACKTGVNPYVQFILFPSSVNDSFKGTEFETEILTRTFCPVWNYVHEIEFELSEVIYSYFEKGEILFKIFHRIPRTNLLKKIESKLDGENILLLGVSSVNLSPLLVCKNGIKKWITIQDPFTGNPVGALEIEVSFDQKTKTFLKIEQNQNFDFPVSSMEFPGNQKNEEGNFSEVCRVGVFIEDLNIPLQILFENVTFYTQRENNLFPCHYFISYKLLGKSKPIETRLYSTSSSVNKINLHHTSEIIQPIGAQLFNYLKNETIEFKLFVCIDEIKSEEEIVKKNAVYLGSCFVNLSKLLFKKLESKDTNLVWISGNYTLINPSAVDLSNGSMKVKVICETLCETACEKLKRVKMEFNWLDDIDNENFEDFQPKEVLKTPGIGRIRGEVRFTPRSSHDSIKEYKKSFRKVKKELEETIDDLPEIIEGKSFNDNDELIIIEKPKVESKEKEINTDDVVIFDELPSDSEEFEQETPKKEKKVEKSQKDIVKVLKFETPKKEIVKEKETPQKEVKEKEIQTIFVEPKNDLTIEKQPINYLNITIFSALHLPQILHQKNEKTNPSCCVTVHYIQNHTKKFSLNDTTGFISRTSIINSCSPVWNFKYRLPIYEEINKLYFQVWHVYSSDESSFSNEIEKNKLIGKCEVNLDVLKYGMDIDGWYEIENNFANVSSQIRICIIPDSYYSNKKDEIEVLPNKESEKEFLSNEKTFFDEKIIFVESEFIQDNKKNLNNTEFEKVDLELEKKKKMKRQSVDLSVLKEKLSSTLLDLENLMKNISSDSLPLDESL